MKILKSYTCEKCAFVTSNKNDYGRHMITRKHQEHVNGYKKTQITASGLYCCDKCNKQFKSRTSIYRHKPKCDILINKKMKFSVPTSGALTDTGYIEGTNNTQINELVAENMKMKAMMIEIIKHNNHLQTQMLDLYKTNLIISSNVHNNAIIHPGNITSYIPGNSTSHNPGNSTSHNPGNSTSHNPGGSTSHNPAGSTSHNPTGSTSHIPAGSTSHIPAGSTNHSHNSHVNINTVNNTNCNNPTFNLNLFLNEQCKDAMNIQEFVNSIQLNMTDLENVGKLGYVEGISNIIIDNLQKTDLYKRPVHCSDVKRETLYVKDDNKWEKEGPEHQKMVNAVLAVEHKNIGLMGEWAAAHPKCMDSGAKENNKYFKLSRTVTDGERNGNIAKVIRRVAKNVVIEK